MFLSSRSFLLQVGHFCFEVETDIPALHDYIKQHYQDSLLAESDDVFVDYSVSIKHGPWYRRTYKPQAEFYFNHFKPFKPLPLEQAHALLEWGMNWVISTSAHQYLIIHAASLEKDGKGMIISAPSGSGKSTLCAYLVSQGWRLLSDELALIEPNSMELHGLSRPMNLKNGSIDVMKPFYDSSHFSEVAVDTHKGTVCLVKPPRESVIASQVPTQPRLIVFVNYNQGERVYIEPVDKPTALVEVIQNSFNFGLLNKAGFSCAKRLVERCHSTYIEYSDFQACEMVLNELLESDVGAY